MTPEEFREAERRKMRLQADIAARRNSLMTMGNASIVPRPDELPSKFDKAVADANNAAALKHLENSGNEFGPQSLNTLAAKGLIMDPFNSLNLYPQVTSSPFTKALNTRAANLTADDQHRVKNRTFGRGFSQGAMDSLYDKSPSRLYDPSLLAAVDGGVGQDTGVDRRTHPAPTWRPPMRYPGVNPERAQSSSPSQASMPNQTGNYGPGLTPAAAEELYGPGGMYGTQPLVRGLYQGKTSSTSGGGSAPRFAKSAAGSMVDSIKSIAKKKAIIAGSVALVGGDPRAADRYEAKALASLGIYAGQYALSNLDDADFQSKSALLKKLSPFMSVSDIATVFNMGLVPDAGGFVDLYNHDTRDVWTGRVDSPEFIKKIKTGDWHKTKPEKTVDSDLMKRNIEALKISNQERDDLRSALKTPLAAIHQTEDSYNKVKVTAKGGRITKDEADNAKEQLKGSGLTAEQMGRGIRDIALINSYQRMIDDATVREGDVRLQQSAASLSEKIGIFFKQVQQGELLSQPQRDEMQSIASDFYNAQINSYFPEIMDAREFLIGKYETSGVPQLTKAAAELDFTQIVGKRLYEKWKKNYEANLESVESMLSGDPVVDQALELQAEAAELGLTIEQYLELQERRLGGTW